MCSGVEMASAPSFLAISRRASFKSITATLQPRDHLEGLQGQQADGARSKNGYVLGLIGFQQVGNMNSIGEGFAEGGTGGAGFLAWGISHAVGAVTNSANAPGLCMPKSCRLAHKWGWPRLHAEQVPSEITALLTTVSPSFQSITPCPVPTMTPVNS